MKKLIYFGLLLFSTPFFAQKNLIEFCPTIEGQPVVLNHSFFVKTIADSIHLEALKFYILDVQFFKNQKLIGTLEKKHWLVDLENSASLQMEFESPAEDFDWVKFKFGTDSLTNVSGAFGGDLDPTNGMYWAWQSGYINFKLEGTAATCPARHHRFQYHLGGYQAPFQTVQKVALKIAATDKIKIQIPMDVFFGKIDFQKKYQIMSPSKEAAQLSKTIAESFFIN